jgi:hypothetical protein
MFLSSKFYVSKSTGKLRLRTACLVGDYQLSWELCIKFVPYVGNNVSDYHLQTFFCLSSELHVQLLIASFIKFLGWSFLTWWSAPGILKKGDNED